jgi:hypothetical protein
MSPVAAAAAAVNAGACWWRISWPGRAALQEKDDDVGGDPGWLLHDDLCHQVRRTAERNELCSL